MHDLEHLYVNQLRDLYDAELQLVHALPGMVQAATASPLKRAFQYHLDQTRQQVTRLERVFDLLQTAPEGKTCEAMQGLIAEGEEIIRTEGDPDVKDAALIAAAQRVEHYEIAAYGTVSAYAQQLGHHDAVQILEETLGEEKETDQLLTDLALSAINKRAETR